VSSLYVDQTGMYPLPTQPLGGDGPLVSRISLGCMGLGGTRNPDEFGPAHIKRAIAACEAAVEAGITLYDHADIYGRGTSERAFGEFLRANPGIRDRLFIATKCGIRPGHYDLSYEHIVRSIDGSLERLGVEYVDLYQMHRPDPFTHPSETARGLAEVVRQGKVRMVGVSNYYPEQVRVLQRYLDIPLRSNQISLSLRRLDPVYDDGVLDQCMALNMTPLAYSPLGVGRLTAQADAGSDPHLSELLQELGVVAENHGATVTQVGLAWLLAMPSRPIPIVGSTDPDHIREAAGAVSVQLTREEWFRLWIAGRGENIP
jgi:predicted oxidoreductase